MTPEQRKAKRAERRANPMYRAKAAARYRERYANDPTYHAKENARKTVRKKERYANDPEFRKRRIADASVWQSNKRAERLAMAQTLATEKLLALTD